MIGLGPTWNGVTGKSLGVLVDLVFLKGLFSAIIGIQFVGGEDEARCRTMNNLSKA